MRGGSAPPARRNIIPISVQNKDPAARDSRVSQEDIRAELETLRDALKKAESRAQNAEARIAHDGVRGGSPSQHAQLGRSHIWFAFIMWLSQVRQWLLHCAADTRVSAQAERPRPPGRRHPSGKKLSGGDTPGTTGAKFTYSPGRKHQRIPTEHWEIANTTVFFPVHPLKERWDALVMVLILYSAVIVPFRVCFGSEAHGVMWSFEVGLTLVFMVDVLFNFNTAYLEDSMWVIDRRLIAKNYLRGWFWIDAPSSTPVELLDLVVSGESGSLEVLRFLRMFRLLRMLRMLKVAAMMDAFQTRIEDRYGVNLGFLRILKMLLWLTYLSHLLACAWYTVSTASHEVYGEQSWWLNEYDGGRATTAGVGVQYLYSVYWALTTLTTVGYGDITPCNDYERAYTLVALLIGALVFGYMVSTIGSLIAGMDRQSATVQDRVDAVKEYTTWRKMPRELSARVRAFYSYYYSHVPAFDEPLILEGLTPALRLEVTSFLLKETVGSMPLFQKLSRDFQAEVFPRLKPFAAAVNEVIVKKGDAPDRIYFLLKG